MLFHDGVYYWYGENKDTETLGIQMIRDNGEMGTSYRTNVIGVSCYSSTDLLHWRNEGLVLKASDEPGHDLHPDNVLERPKVVYHEADRQFVMWMHVDTADYQYARAGVATSDSPTGPFRYRGSVRPNGAMSRDMTLFRDDDGRAYLVFSSEENSTMYVNLLSDDYLCPTTTYTRNLIGMYREAPAMWKQDGAYYLVTSGCTGWLPNRAETARADSPFGPWEPLGDPVEGEGAATTFDSQSTHVFRVEGLENAYILMADRWKPQRLSDSRYIWVPLFLEAGRPVLRWADKWDLSVFY